jgi:hypothetical protein
MEGTGFSPYIQNTNKNRTFVYATKSRSKLEITSLRREAGVFNPHATAR